MKNLCISFAVLLLVISCKPKEEKIEAKVDVYKNYPEAIVKILKKHGGLSAWNNARVLSFKKGEETHTVDLHSRKSLVQGNNYALGFNGKKAWLQEKDSGNFKGNPEFYHNLYFYFYAMPFVLADNGIVYSETEAITFEGKEYPGIKISYKQDIGVSPDDNYFVYYNPETYQMEWLGYTVTYFSKEPSKKVNIIRYNNWEESTGFLLPKSITWYKKDEQGNIDKPANEPAVFMNPLVSQNQLADSFFEKPTE